MLCYALTGGAAAGPPVNTHYIVAWRTDIDAVIGALSPQPLVCCWVLGLQLIVARGGCLCVRVRVCVCACVSMCVFFVHLRLRARVHAAVSHASCREPCFCSHLVLHPWEQAPRTYTRRQHPTLRWQCGSTLCPQRDPRSRWGAWDQVPSALWPMPRLGGRWGGWVKCAYRGSLLAALRVGTCWSTLLRRSAGWPCGLTFFVFSIGCLD